MYAPKHFAETREQEIARIVTDYPLAILVAVGSEGLSANHIPMLLDGPHHLIGHVALDNDLHRLTQEGAEVLAIFRAADAYISPNWYPTKSEHHRHVPTWNYQAAHFYGTIHFSQDTKTKTAVVGKLTRHFEKKSSGDRAWRMADAPRDFMESMLQSIVAFQIDVTRVVAKSKLSQNREAVDVKNVIHMLEKVGQSELAQAMNDLDAKA